MTAPLIRLATPDDATGVARVHIESWHSSYKGIVPDSYLATLDVAERTNRWHERLMQPHMVFVAIEDGKVQGFASGLASREPELGYTAELGAIYLYKQQQGNGLGTALFEAVVEHVRQQGHTSMHLWVLAENTKANAFYQRREIGRAHV